MRLMFQAFFSARKTEHKPDYFLRKEEGKKTQNSGLMSFSKGKRHLFWHIWKIKKKERKKIITPPTTESQPLLMK